MFFGGKQDSQSGTGGIAPSLPDYGYGGSGNSTDEPQGPRPLSIWLCIIIPNLFFLVSFVLNAACFLAMVMKSQCTFTSPLNLLMMTFLLTMAYNALNHLVCSILGEALGMQGQSMVQINQIGDVFSSYFSIILLFLVGMNRAAVYCSPWLMRNFFPRRRLTVLLVFIALMTVGLSLFCYLHCGMSRKMESEGIYEDYVSNVDLMRIFSYVSYGIAMSSTLFYVRVYFYLRAQRTSVVHDKTRELLDKAEADNCRQAAFILFVYSVSLVFFILADNIDQSDSYQATMHILQEVFQSLPGLGIPIAMLFFCPEMNRLVRRVLAGKAACKCKDERSSSSDSRNLFRRTTLSVISVY